MFKERLLNKFSPDDACPLGVQLSLDTTGNIYQSGLKDDKHSDMVICTALFICLFLRIYIYVHCILTCKVNLHEIMQVDIPLFTIDDDIPASGLESQANTDAQKQLSDNLILLSVDDILGSVSYSVH
jgi:hypothetical protein